MAPEAFQNALVLTGPTGSGKTRLGIELAQLFGAEIISMDSMAVYRGIDIAAAKPSKSQRSVVPHRLIDVLDPWQSSTAAWWLQEAEQACREIETRGKRPLFVGGTPLYLKAMMYGLFDGPPRDAELRSRLEKEANEYGPDYLHKKLIKVDAVSAAKIHVNDVRRTVRALEVWELTGKPMSDWQDQWHQAPANLLRCFWLERPRQQLYERIDARVTNMFETGLVEEVERLRQHPKPISREARQAIGYKEVLEHLQGERSLEETIRLVQTHSRNLAKRQMTWFRHLPGCLPISAELTSKEIKATMEMER